MTSIQSELKDWMVSRVLPFWSRDGVETSTGAFYERMTPAGVPDLAAQRRVRVQARQIYVMSHASVLGWLPNGAEVALKAFDRLLVTARAPDGYPGFVHLLEPDGSVANPLRDSYDHAFVVLACTWLARATGEPRVRQVLDETLDIIARDLTDTDGSLHEGLPRSLPRRQNPQMHWFETAIALQESIAHPAAVAFARSGLTLMMGKLYDTQSATIGEFFTNKWTPVGGVEGTIIEPGHLAEWVWLLRKFETVFDNSLVGATGEGVAPFTAALPKVAGNLLASALRFQDPRTGLLVDEATRDGTIRRATRRSWLQTELAKAWIAQADRGVPGAYGKAVEALTVLRDSYLGQPFAEGWLDQRDGDGRAMPGPVSASTLYHIFVAIAEAERLSIPEVGAEAVASA